MDTVSNQNLTTSNPVNTLRPPAISYSQQSTNTQRTSAVEDEQSPVEQRQQERVQQQAENRVLQQLHARDREVRAHEAAHVAAGGRYVQGGASFTYEKGPNGRYYAVGGEVKIDASPVVNNPEATRDKAEVVRRAALAPAEPSAQDLRVAATATRLASRARIEIAIQQREQQLEETSDAASELEETSGVAVDTEAVDSVEPTDSTSSSTVFSPPSAQLQTTAARVPTQPASAFQAATELPNYLDIVA